VDKRLFKLFKNARLIATSLLIVLAAGCKGNFLSPLMNTSVISQDAACKCFAMHISEDALLAGISKHMQGRNPHEAQRNPGRQLHNPEIRIVPSRLHLLDATQ
jgi:hypothetical protein